MKKLFTVGYEGARLADFLATLARHKVSVVVDVRELPLSRRKGYSKNGLGGALAAVGILYRHEKALGAPRDLRHRLRDDSDLATYFRCFDRYLATQGAALEHVAETCMGNVALLCFERDHKTCHRSSVARELGRLADLVPVHLEVGDHGPVRKAASVHPRQGVPAT